MNVNHIAGYTAGYLIIPKIHKQSISAEPFLNMLTCCVLNDPAERDKHH